MKKLFLLLFSIILLAQTAYSKEINYQKKFENAINKGDLKQAQEYLKYDVNVNTPACLICYAAMDNNSEAVDFLLKNGANPNGTRKRIKPLFFAIENGNNEIVDKLIEYKADPNSISTVPLLYFTVIKNNPHAFKKLLYAGADLNKTFMKITAPELALSDGNDEIVDIINEFQTKDLPSKGTDINKAIELLNTIDTGKIFYEAIKGDNKFNAPITVKYTNLSNFNAGYDPTKCYGVSYIINKKMYIYIDNKHRNEPPEVIAMIIAGLSIHNDFKQSKVESLYELCIQTVLYEEFLEKNPKLKDIDTFAIQKNFNPLLELLHKADYNFNVFWFFADCGVIGNNLKTTSPNFRNKDLNSYFIDKTEK